MLNSGEREEIVSMIVSVFSRTVKNRLLSRGLNLTVRHLSLQSPGIPKVTDSCPTFFVLTNTPPPPPPIRI